MSIENKGSSQEQKIRLNNAVEAGQAVILAALGEQATYEEIWAVTYMLAEIINTDDGTFHPSKSIQNTKAFMERLAAPYKPANPSEKPTLN